MRIETSSIKSNVIYTAILIHLVTIVAIPACAAVSIIFLGGKGRHRSEVTEGLFDSAATLNTYIAIFSTLGISLAFLFIYLKNANRKFIVAVEFDDLGGIFSIFHKSYYNNKIRTTDIPYSNLSYQSKIGQTDSNLPNYSPVAPFNSNNLIIDDKISFFDGKKYVGEISMGGTFWNKEGGKIKLIIQKVDELKILQKP